MSSQDIRRRIWDQLREKDLRAFAHLLPVELVLEAARCAVVPAGSGVLHVVNMARLSGANLRYVQAKLPHLQKVLHDDPAEALAGAHVAIVSSADPGVVGAVVAADPAVVIDLNGRLAPLEALPGYEGVGW